MCRKVPVKDRRIMVPGHERRVSRTRVADACVCSLGHPLRYGQFLIMHAPDAEHGRKSHAVLYMAVVFRKSPPKSTPDVVSYAVVGLGVNVNAHGFDVATILPAP